MRRFTFSAVTVSTLFLAGFVQAQTNYSPVEKDFVSNGKVEMTLESGSYEIRPSSDNRIHVRWNEASSKSVRARVNINLNDKFADIHVENTPHDHFDATIEVPAETSLRIRMTAGNMTVSGIKGDKNIELNAGNLKIWVGDSKDWGNVDASVVAGNVDASPFSANKSGLFRSFNWNGPGHYRLHAHLMAGNIDLIK
ncbi:MAG TPA: hypothetical protein VKU42_02150 [Candidatus Angelobacter sp.]|nr:hypothetical protein [Candidatus Angelobacter sp.]